MEEFGKKLKQRAREHMKALVSSLPEKVWLVLRQDSENSGEKHRIDVLGPLEVIGCFESEEPAQEFLKSEEFPEEYEGEPGHPWAQEVEREGLIGYLLNSNFLQ